LIGRLKHFPRRLIRQEIEIMADGLEGLVNETVGVADEIEKMKKAQERI
jgi:hypothetical protein